MALTDEQAEVAAKSLAKNLDYPWSYMTPKGREEMRQMARDAFSAATAPLLARIAELTNAIDQEMCVSHLGVFNDGDDPVAAIKRLMQWSQGVGEYFAGEKEKERIAALTAQVEQAAQPFGYVSLHTNGAFEFSKTLAGVYRDTAKELYTVYTAPPKAVPLTDEQKADMFWNSDDAEAPHGSIDEFLNEEICQGCVEVGAEFTMWRAEKLSSVRIRVTSIDEEECEAEWEVIGTPATVEKG